MLNSRLLNFLDFDCLLKKLLILSMVFVISACSRDGDVAFDDSIKVNQPDRFAAFINPIAGLASGDYVIEANADTSGEAGSFTLSVTYDDGTTEEYNSNWTASVATVTFNITVYTAGGINIKLSSPIENNLRLLNSNGFLVATHGAAVAGDSIISLETSRIDSAAYGAAYYKAIDPNNDKDTLEKWKVANGFYQAEAAGRVLQPRFRDTKDLGYGRGMRIWTKSDGSLYAFVENFQVRSIPGQEYTSLNLDALLSDNQKHHFGTNAIEFSTFPYGVGEPSATGNAYKFVKFYSFDATLGDQNVADHASEVRLDQVDLDDRGLKSMPGACSYCHGGTQKPLRADGTYRGNTMAGNLINVNGINGDVNAKMQLFEVPSFEYGDTSPFTKAEQEPIIKQANLAIYCTYPGLPVAAKRVACANFCEDKTNIANCDGNNNSLDDIFGAATTSGQWDGGFSAELVEGWYDDPAGAGYFDRATFNENYVPPAWRHDSSDNVPPPGSEQLYLEVVQPACLVCHARQGTTLGSDGRVGQDTSFDSYEKFISHAEQIKQYVFERGVMPLSLRGYDEFWAEDSNAPEVLAAHLNGVLSADNQISLNKDNKVDAPGLPVADAGPDRATTSPVRLFGSNSRFVDRYSWNIISMPVGSDAVLTDVNSSRPLLTTSTDGDYEISMVAAFESNVVKDTVRIKIDNGLVADPKKITFDTDIKPIFVNAQCSGCHEFRGVGTVPGVPLYLDDAQPLAGTSFYEEVLARVDFNDPENSLILTKPSNNHHNGGLRVGFEVDNPSNRYNYDLFLNWILEGAPENQRPL